MQVYTVLISALNLQKPLRSASSVIESILRIIKVGQPTKPCTQITQILSPQKFSTSSISYAQAVQGNQNNPKIHSNHSQNSVPNSQNSDNFSRPEKLIEKQSEQINNLLSYLTLIMDKSYLTNRQFMVKYLHATTTTFPIEAGIPQGSVLGPLLFSIYTADLPISTEITIATFADDTALLASHVDPIIISSTL